MKSPLKTDIRAAMKDLIDQFINAYLSVNPKEREPLGSEGTPVF